jgi:NADH-quinone oxidoreductase subunit L
VGWLSVPKAFNLSEIFYTFERWLNPPSGWWAVTVGPAVHAVHDLAPDSTLEWILMLVSVAVAGIGIYVAYYFYQVKPDIPESLARTFQPLYNTLYHKWYVDEIYDFLFVNGLGKGGGEVLGAFDRNVVDGAVNGAGWLTRFSSRVSMWWDTWIVDGAVRLGSFTVKLSSYPVRIVQTGRVQAYALFVVVGALAFFGYYLAR